MERDNDNNPAENTNPDRYVDQVTREKIRNHISDPNSKITQQDIENVNTDIFKRPEEELNDEAMKEEKTTQPEEKIAPKAPNTWDVLGD